jgi:DNA-binding transcriptional ArsR family regulator
MALDWEAIARELVHPTIVEVLTMCEQETCSPKQIADALDAPLGQVSYHVRKLADAGLLELVAAEPRRGALEHFYRAGNGVRHVHVRRRKRAA